jgi:hypothetical protein
MKKIIIKITTFLIIFVSAGAVGRNLMAMEDLIREEETSMYSPRLMFESLVADASELNEEKELELSGELDKLYNIILSKQKIKSDDSVPQGCNLKYFDSIRAAHNPITLEDRKATFQREEVQGFVPPLFSRISPEVDNKQALLKKSIKIMVPPTRKEVKAFVRTFPHDFHPEKANLQRFMRDMALETSSAVWKLSTFLYGHHTTRRLEGESQLVFPDDNSEKHCYEVSYTLLKTKESWPLLLTFAPLR